MTRSGQRDRTEHIRARSFGASAEAYDRGLPGVSETVIDLLVPRGDERLGVGGGTVVGLGTTRYSPLLDPVFTGLEPVGELPFTYDAVATMARLS